jgi:virginiamycin B lyase
MVLLALCGLLAGCGGGAPAGTISGAAPVPTTASSGQAQVRITIPSPNGSSSRRRDYIGSDAAGITVGVGPHGGTLTTYAFALSGATCTTSGGLKTCSIAVAAPYGDDDFAMSIYDAAPISGSIPVAAHLLGTAIDSGVSIVAGSPPPTVAVVIAAQVGTVGVGTTMLTFAADGNPHTASIVVAPEDYNDQPIAGSSTTYANPISVSLGESGGSGHASLTVNGSPSGTSATLTQSNQGLGVSYDGGGSTSYVATITLSAAGATSGTVEIVPMHVSTTSAFYSAGALSFTAPSQQATFTVSEAAGNNAYTAALNSGSCSGSVSGAGSGASAAFTLTSVGPAAAPCSFTIADALGASISVPYTTTTSSGSLSIGGISEYALVHSNSGPEPIIAGPDGHLWVGDTNTNAIDQIATSGADSTFSLSEQVLALAAGNDGNLWFVNASNQVYSTTTSGAASGYTIGGTVNTSLQGITVGPDGNLWINDPGDGQLWQVSAQHVLLATYTLDTGIGAGITSGSDGRLWIPSGNHIWAVAPGGTPVSYPLASCVSASQVANDPVNSMLYVTCNASNFIDVVTTSGSVTPVSTLQSDAPRGIVYGPDGNIWFAAPGTNSIARFDVSTGAITRFAIPTSGAFPIDLCVGPDGRIWFAEFSTSKIGALVP